ncbi:putative nuclease HARBI1 [Aphis gossypii]|uniref:putative nuclease HARBI1 n=1 Tax=Aphis gossypii TaxID=80765 RepID=UPI002158D825|nr:putative nuclease HARBI1 [Aphis gossypii]
MSVSENNMTDDEDFMELALLVDFPRKRKMFLKRPNHFTKWRDEQFFNRVRLSKNTVYFILDHIKERIASPTNRNNAVTPEQKLLITLRYYATGSFLTVCGDFVGVTKSTASQIIRPVSHELALLRPTFINFPSSSTEIDAIRQTFYNVAKFPKCVGAIDCTQVRIISPGGLDAEIYRNRKGYFSINVQTICDADLRIQNIVATFPGSNHGSTIFNYSSIRGKFERGEMKDSILVGDSGYALKTFLMTPFLNPFGDGQNTFNEAQIRTKNAIERSYGVWKKRFPVLAVGINMKLESVESIIVATAVLHNIACYFGEQTPRVTHQLEQVIDLSTFSTRGTVNNVNEDGTLQRNKLVRYFESL